VTIRSASLLNAAAVGVLALFILPGVTRADDAGHTLIVDGQSYTSTKHSGAAIHWETPDADPLEASFAERNQTWTGNGSEHLPCPYGIHWISNDNILTVSHCLEAPPSTLYPTTTSSSTTTAPTTQPSTSSTSTSSTPASTTTAATSTSTSSPTTSTATSPSTSAAASSTTSISPVPQQPLGPPIAIDCTTGVIVNGVCQPTGAGPTTTTPPELAKAGGEGTIAIVMLAAIIAAMGFAVVRAVRRPQ
jgi:hypothetical protein